VTTPASRSSLSRLVGTLERDAFDGGLKGEESREGV
jgi:hypothetical protein